MSSDLVQQTRAAHLKQEPIAQRLEADSAGLALALADRVGVDRFIRAAVTSMRQTPKLAQCTWESVSGGLYVAAQLGLEIGGPRGLAYLVPYGNEATLVLGVRGFIDLMYRAGAKSVDAFIVRQGDGFRIGSNSDAGRFYEWTPADFDDSRKPIGAIAQVRTATGGLVWEYMTEAQIIARRPKYWQSTPWNGPFYEQMWLKTVLRNVAKRVQGSTEVALAVEADETIQRRVQGLPDHQVEHTVAATPEQRVATPRRQQAPPAQQDHPKPRPPRQASPTPPGQPQEPQESQYAAEAVPVTDAPPATGEVSEEEWAEIERQQYELGAALGVTGSVAWHLAHPNGTAEEAPQEKG